MAPKLSVVKKCKSLLENFYMVSTIDLIKIFLKNNLILKKKNFPAHFTGLQKGNQFFNVHVVI